MTRLEYIRQMHDGRLIGFLLSLISSCAKCPAKEACRAMPGVLCEDVLAKYLTEEGVV